MIDLHTRLQLKLNFNHLLRLQSYSSFFSCVALYIHTRVYFESLQKLNIFFFFTSNY